MKVKSILSILIFSISLAASSQNIKKPQNASTPENITSEELVQYKSNLINYLQSLPSWNERTDLEENIFFTAADIQVYGYFDFPILQIDFRYTFPSTRKKGYNYQAQYIYIDQPTLNKNSVVIDVGTTKYIKQ